MEIEPLRNVGVALSQNTLQELANSLGIKQRVAQMSEAQKAQLRYIQILKSTTEWQGDMARTLISPANALRVLQQQFTLLGRAIGRVFLPIVMKLLPYVMALTQILTDLANKLSAWTGYKIADIDYSSLGKASSFIGDIGDEAEDTTKKLNTMLAPFDELNVVQSENKKSGNDKSLGGDLGLDLPQYDALAGLTDQLSKNVDKARENLEKFGKVALVIGGILAAMWGIGKINKFANALEGLFVKTSGGLTLFGKLSTSFVKMLKGTNNNANAFQKLSTKIARVGTGLVALGAGIALSSDGMYKLGKRTGITTLNLIEFGGGVASATAGGALLGSAILPGLGTAIGAVGGALISATSGFIGFINGMKAAKIEAAKKDVFGDLVISTQSFKDMLNRMDNQTDASRTKLDELSNTISNTKDSFDKSLNSVGNYLYQFSIMGDKINEEDGQKFKDSLDKLFSDANKIIDTSSEQALTIVSTSLSKGTLLTDSEQKNILDSITTNGELRKTKLQGIEDKVYDIYNNGLKDRGYLTNEEKKQIQDLMDKIDELTTRAATQTETDLLLSQQTFNADSQELAEESYKNLKEATNDYVKERKETAKKSYNEMYNLAKTNAYDTLINLKENNIEVADELQNLWDLREKKDETGYAKALEQLKTHNITAATEFENLWKIRTDTEDQALHDYNIAEADWENTTNTAIDNVVDGLAEKYSNLLASDKKNAKEQRKVIENTLKGMDVDFSEFQNKVKDKLSGIGFAGGVAMADAIQTSLNKARFEANLETGGAATGSALGLLKFTKRAEGGFPKTGEFFMAREAGPEMVGKIGNKTAVANNDQITTSITNALITAFSGMNFGGGKGTTIVNIGGRKVYEGVGDYVDSENDRYGTNYVHV